MFLIIHWTPCLSQFFFFFFLLLPSRVHVLFQFSHFSQQLHFLLIVLSHVCFLSGNSQTVANTGAIEQKKKRRWKPRHHVFMWCRRTRFYSPITLIEHLNSASVSPSPGWSVPNQPWRRQRMTMLFSPFMLWSELYFLWHTYSSCQLVATCDCSTSV